MLIQPQEYFEANPGEMLGVISSFIGLGAFDWSHVRIHSFSFADSKNETVDDLPISPDVARRLREFFAHNSTTYYEKVKVRGYYGC